MTSVWVTNHETGDRCIGTLLSDEEIDGKVTVQILDEIYQVDTSRVSKYEDEMVKFRLYFLDEETKGDWEYKEELSCSSSLEFLDILLSHKDLHRLGAVDKGWLDDKPGGTIAYCAHKSSWNDCYVIFDLDKFSDLEYVEQIAVMIWEALQKW